MSRLETLMELADCARKDAKLNQWDDHEQQEALESEAQRAEHEGLMVCGDDEWASR